MKSQTMMPPMSRRRTWRAISLAASTLVRTIVSSRFLPPVNLPELTSMTVSASVDSITIEPPDGQLDGRLHQARDLVVDLEVGEEALPALVVLDPVDVLRPEQAHEVAHVLDLVGRVEPDVLDLGGDEVARGLVDQVHVLVQQGRRLDRLVLLEDAVPHADQHAEVGDQLGVGDAGGRGAHDGRHALGPDRLHDRLEPVALVGRLDLARDAAELAGRHEDQVAAGERDVGRDPGALEPARLLDDLHQHVVAAADLLVDGVAGAARGDLDVADVERRLVDVVDVEEGVAAQPDVAEAGAHAGQDVDDLPFVDRADDALFALDVDLRETTVLEDRDAVLPRIARDENVGRQSVVFSRTSAVRPSVGRTRDDGSPSSSGRHGRALPSSGVREIGVEPAGRSSANPNGPARSPQRVLCGRLFRLGPEWSFATT